MAGLIDRFRIWLLAALVASAAVAFWTRPQSAVLLMAVAAGFTTAFAGLRHLSFAALTALAPLPALLWFADSRLDFAFATQLPPGLIGFTADPYPLLFASSLVMALAMARIRLDGGDKKEALRAGLTVLPAIAAMLAFAASVFFREAVLPYLAGGAVAVLAVMAGAAALPFGERFHFAANRAREGHGFWLEPATRLSERRWALSFCGVALVLAVLTGFAGEGDGIGVRLLDAWPGLLVALAAMILVGRDMRSGLAALACLLLLTAFGGLTGTDQSLFLLFAVQLAGAARTERREDRFRAWSRALERELPGLVFALLGAAACGFVLDGAPVTLEAARGGLVALVLFPALDLGLHALLPRRLSIKERYGS